MVEIKEKICVYKVCVIKELAKILNRVLVSLITYTRAHMHTCTHMYTRALAHAYIVRDVTVSYVVTWRAFFFRSRHVICHVSTRK